MNTFCILDPKRSPLSLRVQLEDDLRAGGDFKIIDPETQQVIEHFKLEVVSRRSDVYTIKTPVSQLNKMTLVWSVLICSRNPNNFKGKIEIDITQFGLSAKVSEPLSWNLKNIPPCKHKSYEKINDSLMFVLKDVELPNPTE